MSCSPDPEERPQEDDGDYLEELLETQDDDEDTPWWD